MPYTNIGAVEQWAEEEMERERERERELAEITGSLEQVDALEEERIGSCSTIILYL